jgi:N-glycosylase/DNA lyase
VLEVWAGREGARRMVRIPPPELEVMPGVMWGRPETANTPAYWAVRCCWDDDLPDYTASNGNLIEETGFCLLGGFGVKYEVNVAAFERLREHGVFCLDSAVTGQQIVQLLSVPLVVSNRTVRYRFPNQRGQRLAAMRDHLKSIKIDQKMPLEMRNALQLIDGIGPKTASWIVRNMLDSDDVAIIDIHILRACCMMGVFPEQNRLPRDYSDLERRFIDFSCAIDVRPSVLDAVMWLEMRSVPARKWARH